MKTLTALEKLEVLEERCARLEDEMNLVTGKSWEVRHEVYNQVLREIRKVEKQLSQEAVSDLIAA